MSISKEGIVLRVAPYRLRTSVLEFIVESSVGDDEFDLHSTLIAKSVVASVHQLRRRVPDPLHSDTLKAARRVVYSNVRTFARVPAAKSLTHLEVRGSVTLVHPNPHEENPRSSGKLHAFPLLATVPFLGPAILADPQFSSRWGRRKLHDGSPE